MNHKPILFLALFAVLGPALAESNVAIRVTVASPAKIRTDAGAVRDPDLLRPFMGMRYDGDAIADYFDPELQEIGLTGGFIRLEWRAATTSLWTCVDYWAPRRLTPKEGALLIDDTNGQLSDGIGENLWYDLEVGNNTAWVSFAVGAYQLEMAADPDVKPMALVSPMFRAVRLGNTKKVRALIAAGDLGAGSLGTNFGKPLTNGTEILHWAVSHHQTEIFELLMQEGIRDGLPGAMNTASQRGHQKIIQLGLAAGFDVNDPKAALVCNAANHDHLPLLKFLHQAGAKLNVQSPKWGDATPLHLAGPRDEEMIRWLLRRGVDPFLRDSQGRNAIDDALRQAEFADEPDEIERRESYLRKARLLVGFKRDG